MDLRPFLSPHASIASFLDQGIMLDRVISLSYSVLALTKMTKDWIICVLVKPLHLGTGLSAMEKIISQVLPLSPVKGEPMIRRDNVELRFVLSELLSTNELLLAKLTIPLKSTETAIISPTRVTPQTLIPPFNFPFFFRRVCQVISKAD